MSDYGAGPELDLLVAERVIGEVEAHAPCGDGMTRTDTFGGPTLADCDELIRKGYARAVAKGMKLWPAQYIGPEYSTDIAAAMQAAEKVVERTRVDFRCGYGPNFKGEPRWWAFFGDDCSASDPSSLATAISLAALRAVGT